MTSIINGLFAGRAGIASHGAAIAVVGDNIANSSTVGFKAARAEFEDVIAGGQTAGRVVGSGSINTAVTTIGGQGSVENTGRALDLAIDGNGFFVVADGAQRFYSRAGNFKLDPSGYIVDQNGFAVLGFPANGTGSLEPINTNTVSQDSVATANITISGNLDASEGVVTVPTVGAATTAIGAVPGPNDPTYAELNGVAAFSTTVEAFDSLGASHTLNIFFYKSSATGYTAQTYVNESDVNATSTHPGYPRLLASSSINLGFSNTGARTGTLPTSTTPDVTVTAPWSNGSSPTQSINISFSPFTSFATSSNILSITQDGQGIGTITSLNIEKNGQIFALLSNGQSSTVGTLGLSNFANPEGLTRIGKNLLQQSGQSGEPIIGNPTTGTFGSISAGSLELSTVDIANEFVKLIQLQRGYQASSKIITTVNQLLSEIIQLV